MNMTRDRIEELKRKAQATDTYLNPRLEREFAAACDPKTILSLLALAERALEPQGQALDDMYDAIEDTPEAAATFWREEPEPGMPLAVERFTWHLKVQVPPGRANFENLFTARQMIAHGRKCWEAGRASQLALPAAQQLIGAGHFTMGKSGRWAEVDRNVPNSTILYHGPEWPETNADPFSHEERTAADVRYQMMKTSYEAEIKQLRERLDDLAAGPVHDKSALEPQGQALPELHDGPTPIANIPPPCEYACVNGVSQPIWTEKKLRAYGLSCMRASLHAEPTRQKKYRYLKDEQIIHLWDTHVGVPNEKYPFSNRDVLIFARAIAYASQLALPAGPVPESYVLMPIETTEEMLKAVYPLHWWDSPGKKLAADYKTLVAAAPKLQTAGGAEPVNAQGLKCCPFCGDMGVHAERIDSHWWGIHCPNGDCPSCSLWLAKEESEEECIRQFNRRAPRSSSPAVAQPVADENELWDLLDAVDEALDRKAVPHAWVSYARTAGHDFIMKRRAALCQPAEEGDKA